MELFQDEFAVGLSADLKFTDIVSYDELEALGVAVKPSSGPINNIDALLERDLKVVAYPGDGHALVKVVRTDPDAHQRVVQRDKGILVVVDAAQKYGLVVDCDPGLPFSSGLNTGFSSECDCLLKQPQ